MATKYWRVGGTNLWSSTANWSTVSPSGATGAAIPVVGDDVVISNVGQTAGTINIGATATAKLNSWTVIGGTWTVAGATQVNIAGTFDCQNVTWTNTGILSLQGTGGSYDINTSGTTFGCSVQLNAFNVLSSSFNLLSAFTTGATQTTTLTGGTLILNNFTLTTGIFNAAATNVRAITFGTGNIALIHTTAATTVLSLLNYSNFTCSGTGGFTSAMTITRTFSIGSVTGLAASNAVNLALTSGTSIPTFAVGNRIGHLNFTGSSITMSAQTVTVGSLTLSSGGTYTSLTVATFVAGTINTNGKPILAFTVNNTLGGTTTLAGALSVGVTGTTTLTQNTLDLDGFTLTTGIFSSSNTNTRAIAFGTGSIVLSHTSNNTVVLSMATATFFDCTGTGGFTVAAMGNTRTFTFGTSGTGWSNAPNLTFTTGASNATITTLGSFDKLNFGTTSFNPGAITVNVTGLTLSSTGTYTTLTVIAGATGTVPRVASGTILSNGKTILALTLNHTTEGTTTLGADLSLVATGTTTLTQGTLALAGNFLTTGIFSSNNTNTRAISFSAGNIILAHTGAGNTVLSMATATGFTWTGTGGFTATMSVTRTFVFGTTGGTSAIAPNLTLSSGASVATLTTGSWFNTLDFGTTSSNPGTTALNLNGLTLSSTGTYTALTATMVGTGTITSNGKTIASPLTINHAGTTTLGAALSMGVTGTTTLTQGTLALAGFTLTTGIFSSNNTNTRAIAFGTGSIALSHTTAGTEVLSMFTVTGFTWTGTGGFTVAAMSVTRTFTVGPGDPGNSGPTGTSANAPNLTFTTGASVATFTDGISGSWFNTLNFGTTSFTPANTVNVNALTLSSGGTYTSLTVVMVGTGTITNNGKTLAAFGVNSAGTATLGAALSVSVTGTTTLTAGTLALAGFTLTTGIFSSNNTNTRAIAFGTGSIALSHTTAGTEVLSMATATGFTWTGTGGFTVPDMSVTRTFTFGPGDPGVSDPTGTSANAPNLTFTTGASVASFTDGISGSWFNTLNFGTTSFTPANTVNVNSITLSSGGTYTSLTVVMVGTGTITLAGKTLAAFGVNSAGTATLSAALTVSGALTLTQGTLACSIYNVQSATFASTGIATRSMTGSGTYTITGSGTTAFVNASTGITISGVIISLTNASAKTFEGGGGSYGILTNFSPSPGSALSIIGSNSFADIQITF